MSPVSEQLRLEPAGTDATLDASIQWGGEEGPDPTLVHAGGVGSAVNPHRTTQTSMTFLSKRSRRVTE